MKRFRGLLTALVVLAALYFMPFVTVEASDDAGRTWRVPFGTAFAAKSETDITFSGYRSGYSLSKDSENAIRSGEEIKCYGNTYYYQEDKDVSLTGYTVQNGFPSAVTYHFEKGNACKGWTLDDEVAWEVGALEDADMTIDPMKAAQDLEWFVIVDGKALNPGIYNDFSRLVKQGVYSILRTMIVENGEVKLIDIQLLETPVEQQAGSNKQEAYYRAAVRTAEGIEENYYTRYSETAETNPRRVSVFEKDGEGVEHETVLFTYSVG